MPSVRVPCVAALVSTIASACLALAACFGDSGAPPPPDHDSGPSESAAPDSPAQDAGPQPEASPEGGPLCTNLDLSNAPFVATVSNVIGAAPAMTGGAIVAGDYAYTGVTAYDPTDAEVVTGTSPERSLLRFGATSYHADTQVWYSPDAGPDSSPDIESVVVQDFTTNGNTWTITLVCSSLLPDASGQTSTGEYTATPTAFQFLRPLANDSGIVEVVTYTKQ